MNDQKSEPEISEDSSSPLGSGMTRQEYWKKNITCVLSLLVVWFVVSYGCGILFVEQMNKISIGGAQFGFWMAQQGSIYVFVVLIFVYVRLMNRLDREFTGTCQNEEKVQTEGEDQS